MNDGLRYREGFEPPETVQELLLRARAIVADEERWTQGAYVERPTNDEPADCTNVRACAVGAVEVARFDGAIVRAYLDSGVNEDIPEQGGGALNAAMAIDTLLHEAKRLLDDASAKVVEEDDLTNSVSWGIICLNDMNVSVAAAVNHDEDSLREVYSSDARYAELRREHLQRVLRAFDYAIEAATPVPA